MTTDRTNEDTRARTPDEHTSVDHRRDVSDHPGGNGHGDSETGTDTRHMLASDERSELREHWDRLQTRFVDDPQGATKEADELLSRTLDRIAERWQEHHRSLRDRWSDDDPSTEELRTSLKRYRDAFERLLST